MWRCIVLPIVSGEAPPQGYDTWRRLNPEWAGQFEAFRRRNPDLEFEAAWHAFEAERRRAARPRD